MAPDGRNPGYRGSPPTAAGIHAGGKLAFKEPIKWLIWF
jgi:hypothetical protein